MWPKVSVSLTKKQFLFIQENYYTSKMKIYPLNDIVEEINLHIIFAETHLNLVVDDPLGSAI